MKRQYEQGSAFLTAETLTSDQVTRKVEEARTEIKAKIQEEMKD
jgi:hypothetical protein